MAPLKVEAYRIDLMYRMARAIAYERAMKKITDFGKPAEIDFFNIADFLTDAFRLVKIGKIESMQDPIDTMTVLAILEEYELVLPVVAVHFEEFATVTGWGAALAKNEAEQRQAIDALQNLYEKIQKETPLCTIAE